MDRCASRRGGAATLGQAAPVPAPVRHREGRAPAQVPSRRSASGRVWSARLPNVRTFGIDLASQPDNTAVCLVEWRPDQAAVVELARGKDRYGDRLHDKRLMHAMLGDLYGPAPAMTAIDAPLGWPTLFAHVISNQADWPDGLEENPAELLLRATDLFVGQRTGKRPLSVTTERIAYAAFRANRLLGRLERATSLHIDRSGTAGVVCETYPDAA